MVVLVLVSYQWRSCEVKWAMNTEAQGALCDELGSWRRKRKKMHMEPFIWGSGHILQILVSIRSTLEMGERFVSLIKKDKQMVSDYDIFQVEWSSSNWMILSKISHNGVTHKRCNVQVSILLGHGDVIQNRGKGRTQIDSPTFYCGKKRKEPHLTTCHPLLERKEQKGAVSFIPFVFLNGGQTKKKRFQGL